MPAIMACRPSSANASHPCRAPFLTRSASRPDRLIIVPDIQVFPDLPDAALYAQCRMRTIVGAGMWRDDRLIGLINVKSIGTVRQFTADELALLQRFAAQAAIAIENTQPGGSRTPSA